MQMPPPTNQLYLNRYKKLLSQYSNHTADYTEIHHICPKSLGGDNSNDNLIRLSSRVHFLAHWMLWKAYNTEELAYAFWAMCHQKKSGQEQRYTKINSKTYKLLKEKRSELIRKSNSNRWKNPQWADKMKQKLSDAASSPQEKIRRSIQATTNNIKYKEQNRLKKEKFWADPQNVIEFKNKLKDANKHRLKLIIVDSVEYNTVAEVSKKYSISIATVRQRIKSKTNQFSGWKYKT
jgi:hypothetical protein